MSDIPEQSTQVATRPTSQPVSSAMALFDSDKFAHMQRMAKALQFGSMLPRAVRGENPDECFSNLLVCFDMADRLKVTPIALAQTVSMVHGKMVLEGKLVQAAIQNILDCNLYPYWTGERGTDAYRIYLSDKSWDEESVKGLQPGAQFFDRRVIDGSVGEWKTKDKNGGTMPAWTGTQTQNQTLYRGTREWARRFEPGIMLGVYTDDEITAAEERGNARTVQAVSLSALPTGFAGQAKAEEPAEDAVIEEVTSEGWDDKAFQHLLEVASIAATTGKLMDCPDGLSDEQRGTYVGTVNGIIDALPTAQDLQQMDAAFETFEASKEKAVQEADDADRVIERGSKNTEEVAKAIAEHHTETAKGKPARKPRGQKNKAPAPAPAPAEDTKPEPELDDAATTNSGATEVGDDAMPMNASDPNDPIDAFMDALQGMATWADIKGAFVTLFNNGTWVTLDPREQKAIRAQIWTHMDSLIQAQIIRFDFLNDLTAFRCWLEWYGEKDGILGNWDVLVTMDHFMELDDAGQQAMQSAVSARILELTGGRH